MAWAALGGFELQANLSAQLAQNSGSAQWLAALSRAVGNTSWLASSSISIFFRWWVSSFALLSPSLGTKPFACEYFEVDSGAWGLLHREDFDGGGWWHSWDSKDLLTRRWGRYVDVRRQRTNVVHEASEPYGHLTKWVFDIMQLRSPDESIFWTGWMITNYYYQQWPMPTEIVHKVEGKVWFMINSY
jgi:hypothetical protein